MNRLTLSFALSCSLSLTACGGLGSDSEFSTPPSPADAGRSVSPDAGAAPVQDAGGSTADDAGAPFDGGNAVGVIDAGVAPPRTITVAGVLRNDHGHELDGATVIILGKGPTTTDGRGRFVFDGVTPPYDIVAVVTRGTPSLATMYQGLTRKDPQLTIFDSKAGYNSKAQFVVDVGGASLASTDTSTVFMWAGFSSAELEGQREATQFVDWVGATYRFSNFWAFGGAPTGSLVGLQIRRNDATQYPEEYAFARADDVTIANATTVNRALAFGPVDTTVLSYRVGTPQAFGFEGSRVELVVDDRVWLRLYENPTLPNVAVKVPRVAGARLAVSAWASRNDDLVYVRREVDSGAAQSLEMRDVDPALGLPLPNAAGIDLATQSFSWAPIAASAISLVNFETESLDLVIVTSKTSLRFPPTVDMGLGSLAPGSVVKWHTESYPSDATVDAVADPARSTIWPSPFASPADVTLGTSATRTFTTK